MNARGVWFSGARQAEICEEAVREPGPAEVMIRASVSLISAGTEMLVYRGHGNPEDLLPPNCQGSFDFPIKYGYQVVGRVEAAGPDSGFATGDRVFARHPHQDLFTTATAATVVTHVPDDVSDDAAAFLNLMRVALTANIDEPVRVGEVVVVFGQGIVGALCARLARRNAGTLIVVDPVASRRALAIRHGADVAVGPADVKAAVDAATSGYGADICFEASGAPAGLQSAIDVTRADGTIVAMSYFGNRAVELRLAPEFHFRRLRIVSSLAGTKPRWDPQRRTEAALKLLARTDVSDLISTRLPFHEAPHGYELLDAPSDPALGVLLTYEGR